MEDLHPNLLSWALDPEFLKDRMSFIAGPRQIGKTTLLQNYLRSAGHPQHYFNWDRAQTRQDFLQNPDFFVPKDFPPSPGPLPIVFDELHKYPDWKHHLKGLYDSWKGRIRFIVTGSARLEFMRKSGESLLGRYFLFRKLPLHPREVVAAAPRLPDWLPGQPWEVSESAPEWKEALEALFRLNGFPEPFVAHSQEFLTRWKLDHRTLLVTEDLADLTKIEKILKVEALAELLRKRVGSPLSTNSLREDLNAPFASVKRWLDALDLVYLTFRIPPYAKKLARALKKEPKLYFWDWSHVAVPSFRFENMLAVQLMRAIHCWNERGLGQFSLYYLRTRDGGEVDFLIANQERPLLLVEAKLNETEISPWLLKYKAWLKAPEAWQVVLKPGVLSSHREKGVWLMGADRFLQLTP